MLFGFHPARREQAHKPGEESLIQTVRSVGYMLADGPAPTAT